MPRFIIQLKTATYAEQPYAVDVDDLAALRIEAARFVGEILRDEAERIWKDQDWRVDVTDEDGLLLFAMSIIAEHTAATMSLRW